MNFTYTPNCIALYDTDNNLLAEVVFPDIDEDTVNINRTFVDDSLRGQGIAGKLMKAVAAELRAKDKKAVPSCPYARKWFSQHAGYEDILA